MYWQRQRGKRWIDRVVNLFGRCFDNNKERFVLIANRFGRCFPNKIERFYLEQLQPGDHIVEERWFICIPIYWHHMIVEKVDVIQNLICVIHYYDKQGPSGFGSVVCRTLLPYIPNK